MIVVRHDPLASYPSSPPYGPSELYPEYPFDSVSDQPNVVYRMVRDLLADMELDIENYGSANWNPLGRWVQRGGRVAIKPNWVWDPPYAFEVPESLDATVTHSSVIRAILDYAFIAVGNTGRISVLDSPIEDADWSRLHTWNGFAEVCRFYRAHTHVNLELIDLRDFRSIHTKATLPLGRHHIALTYRKRLPGDPRGYVKFDIRELSEFNDSRFVGARRLRSPQKWTGKEALAYHSGSSHIYHISRTLLDSDLVLNLPKLKHHRKAGVTLCLKSVIGATNKKNALPHFRAGPPPEGDEHPLRRSYKQKIVARLNDVNILRTVGFSFDTQSEGKRALPCDADCQQENSLRQIRVGDWYGSDTLWRTILDLNRVVLCGGLDGTVGQKRQRGWFSIIDGVVGGEKQSPLHPSPRKSNLILASEDPVALDWVAAYLMGFDPRRIPVLLESRGHDELRNTSDSLDETPVAFNRVNTTTLGAMHRFLAANRQYITRFVPSAGWYQHIEMNYDD